MWRRLCELNPGQIVGSRVLANISQNNNRITIFSPFAVKQVFPLAASSFLEGDLSKPEEGVVRFSKKKG